MRGDIPAGLIQEYIDASAAKLGEMARCLAHPDPQSLEQFANIAHNFKGTGGIYGLDIVSDIGSRLDDAVRRVQEGKIQLTPQLIEILRLGVSALREVLGEAGSGHVTVTAKHRFFADIDRLCKR